MFRVIYKEYESPKSINYRIKEEARAQAEQETPDSQSFGLCVYDEKLRRIVWIAPTEDFESVKQYLPVDIVNS